MENSIKLIQFCLLLSEVGLEILRDFISSTPGGEYGQQLAMANE